MQKNSADHEKMLGLEIIRFISAIAVLLFHYKNFTYVGLHQIEPRAEALPHHDILWFFYKYGNYGVQAFWTLSGFIFYWKYIESIPSKSVNAWHFFVLRLSRLYPLHILTLVAVAALQFGYTRANGEPFACDGNDWFHFALHLFMASSWRGQWGLSFNAPIWSVSVEVLIYALFFLILRLGIRSFWSCVLIVAICIGARNLNIDNRVLMCAAFFFTGGATAMAGRQAEASGTARLLHRLALTLTLVLPIVYITFFSAGWHGPRELAFVNLWIPCLVMYLAKVQIPSVAHLAPGLEVAGNVTYASYLLHFPIQIALALYFTSTGADVPYGNTTLLLVFVLGTLTLSLWVYRFFERPAQQRVRDLLLKK